MWITITKDTFITLSKSTREELIRAMSGKSEASFDELPEFEWEDVVDLSPDQVSEFMEGCAEKTIEGLKVFAVHGPVINAKLLEEAGIDNYAKFQGSITRRTRTITGKRHAFLFSWDDWTTSGDDGVGRYAVTKTTFQSLRQYFGIN